MKTTFVLLALVAASQLVVPTQAQEVPTARLVGTVLNVASIDKELAFYQTAFGMKLAMTLDHGTRREYMLRFSADPGEAGLILVHDTRPDAPSKLPHGAGFDRIVLRVADMDALIARLDAAGVPHAPAGPATQGYRVLQLQDPEGYPLEVIQSTRSAGAGK